MRRKKKSAAGLLAAIAVLLAAQAALFCLMGLPRIHAEAQQKEWEGLDLLRKYQENHDMAGWLQVEGTNINYPVMKGDAYLYRSFNRKNDASGSLFVERDWSEGDLCTLVYGHNMWMYGTMFNALHRFADRQFFDQNRIMKLYVIRNKGEYAEKRTYEISCCIRTRVDVWNYASCRYISTQEELAAFMEACGRQAVRSRTPEASGEGVLVLSTCSYHVGGGKGRLLLVGSLADTVKQDRIDLHKNQPRSI